MVNLSSETCVFEEENPRKLLYHRLMIICKRMWYNLIRIKDTKVATELLDMGVIHNNLYYLRYTLGFEMVSKVVFLE